MKCNRNTPLALERHALEREIGELRRQVRQLRFEQDMLMQEELDPRFGVYERILAEKVRRLPPIERRYSSVDGALNTRPSRSAW
jgi:hypothetical protein